MSDELETAYRDDLREQCEQISTSERRYTRIVVHVDEVLSLLNDAARLADAEEELSQWRATGESVLRNEHDLAARLAEADGAIESAVRCLAMCNDGPREALLILNAYKRRNREWRTDSTSGVKP